MWDLLFDWNGLIERGYDALAYAVMAIVGTVLFLLRLSLAMFGGDADGGDAEVHGDTDATFSMFSLLSFLAFFMGAGWMGLACRLDWNLGRLLSALIASGFGFAMLALSSGMMYGVRRLNLEIGYDVNTTVGRTGRVYLTVPGKGEGNGQVEITVSGRKKVLAAISTGPAIPAFTDVTVVDVRDDGTLIVETQG